MISRAGSWVGMAVETQRSAQYVGSLKLSERVVHSAVSGCTYLCDSNVVVVFLV